MTSASAIRLQIETALAQRIPSALTPVTRIVRPVETTGIGELDKVLKGGFPVGAISELMGPECSGRTSVALSFLARITQAAKVCAWIDVSNAFDPVSAAAAGVDLSRLLWVRCGSMQKCAQQASRGFSLPNKYLIPRPAIEGLHGGGFGPHPRTETKGLSEEISGMLRPEAVAPRFEELQRRDHPKSETFRPGHLQTATAAFASVSSAKPWKRIDQALRAADLLLQGGGFSAIVLDMGSLAAEFVSQVPLATWFRYRAAAERTQSSILLLTQYSCAKSSAELLLRLQPGNPLTDERTVFTGIEYGVEVVRRRFTGAQENVVPLRKPPQSAHEARWQSRTAWAGRR